MKKQKIIMSPPHSKAAKYQPHPFRMSSIASENELRNLLLLQIPPLLRMHSFGRDGTESLNLRGKTLKRFYRFSKGFTLIELLVVIAIIGVLASIITLGVNNARVKSRDAKRAGDMRQMITALEQYYIHNASYPTGTGSVPSGPGGNGVTFNDQTAFDSAAEMIIPNYLPFIPRSPEPADGDCLNTATRGSNNYWYESMEDGSSYTITFCLGKDTESWAKGIRFASPNGVQ